MSLRIPAPRLLPMTIVAMMALLGLKTTHLVRAALPPGVALATEAPVAKAETPSQPQPQPKPAVQPAPEENPVSAQERALLLDLRHRNAELEAREAVLNTRDAVLAAAEKRLTVRLEELGTLQKQLQDLEAGRKARDETNWQGLVKLYEQMKPREAAIIFNDLDKPVLLQVLDRMKEARAAPILAAMQPDRARQVTADIAQMRARANQAPGPSGGPVLSNANSKSQGTR